MALDTFTNRLELIAGFPQLIRDPMFKITSEKTRVYNCIAWAMGFNDRWVTHYAKLPGYENPNYWWPEGAEVSERKEALISAFKIVGFEIAKTYEPEQEYDKVILYENGGIWKHAARLIDTECAHSKFGGSFDGSHGIKAVTGIRYGLPYVCMKRPKANLPEIMSKYRIETSTEGEIKINDENRLNALRLLRKNKLL